jgi:hypothetical protein
VHADTAFGTQVQVHLNRLGQIDVLHAHEPARQAGADGNESDVEPPALLLALPVCKMPSRIDKILAIASVATELTVKAPTENSPGAPQCPIAVMYAPPGPVLRRGAVKIYASMYMVLPPI